MPGRVRRVARLYPQAMRRAGHRSGEALFETILAGRSGVTFTVDEYTEAWRYVRGGRIALEIPELLAELRALPDTRASWTSEEFPFVLAAGERRAYSANTIIRDPPGAAAMRPGRYASAPKTPHAWAWPPVTWPGSSPRAAAPRL